MTPDLESFSGTDRFRVLRCLGVGGMGVVYEVLDHERGCRAALKTLRTPSAQALLRLKNEFRALQDLEHPNLVSLGELLFHQGRWFFTMELVEGVDLIRHVRPGFAPAPAHGTCADASGGTGETGEGVPPPAHLDAVPSAPSSGRLDEERLREAFCQLGEGLCVLHATGKVHRDLKPSNILVTAAGRVVVLDFGLVTGASDGDQSTDEHIVGTAAYMAPEQAASRPVGPASDWYSVGVLLYQALTGTLPFSGPPLRMLLDKQHRQPAPPRSVDAAVPPDLDALCEELLTPEPQQRPDGPAVLRRLARSRRTRTATDGMLPSLVEGSDFVGRAEELAALAAAFELTRRGEPAAAVVEGESGIGKSALLRRFLGELEEGSEETVILFGRCYEREAVPFKAVDGVMDALGRYLARLPEHEHEAFLPRAIAAARLGAVFPTLRRVKGVARHSAPLRDGEVDPQEQRARLFAAVREMLGRLADRRRVVVAIDDLQWADVDSLALLGEVLRPPEAPALLLVATMREGVTGPAAQALEAGTLFRGLARRIQLGRLSPDEARGLARLLLRRAESSADLSEAHLALDAGGHPLFIDELVRRLALGGERSTTPLRLDEVLQERVAQLEETRRVVLELIAVAGRPVAQEVVARAASLGSEELGRCLSELRVGKLVQTRGARGADTVAPYHDRIREAVVAMIEPATRRGHHAELALALEATGQVDPQQLAIHWQGAGDHERGAHYFAKAAVNAAGALAFDHAAELYRTALELHEEGSPQRDLQLALGQTLANAGRGAEAAAVYLEVAGTSPPDEALGLRSNAAEQFLRSGHIDEGLAVIRAVLDELGLHFPATPMRALASLVRHRLVMRLRGLRYLHREPRQVTAAELTRMDACWSLANTLTSVDTIRGAAFSARAALMALRLGEPLHLARALAMEALHAAMAGGPGRRRARRLISVQGEVATRLGRPEAQAWSMGAHAFADYYTGEFLGALGHLKRAEELWRDRIRSVGYELDTALTFQGYALYYLGRLGELARRMPQLVEEALDRGDRYLATNLSLSVLNAAWLVPDQPETAERVMREALRAWSAEGSLVHHWYGLTAQAQLDLYRGDGADGYRRLTERWRALEGSLILRIQLVRIEAHHLMGRAALAAAVEDGADRPRLLAEAERAVRRIDREQMAWSSPLAHLMRAGVYACRDQVGRAQRELRVAIKDFDAAHMAAYAAAARHRLGQLLGGDEGQDEVAAAEAWMRQETVVNPSAWTRMLAPGFPTREGPA